MAKTAQKRSCFVRKLRYRPPHLQRKHQRENKKMFTNKTELQEAERKLERKTALVCVWKFTEKVSSPPCSSFKSKITITTTKYDTKTHPYCRTHNTEQSRAQHSIVVVIWCDINIFTTIPKEYNEWKLRASDKKQQNTLAHSTHTAHKHISERIEHTSDRVAREKEVAEQNAKTRKRKQRIIRWLLEYTSELFACAPAALYACMCRWNVSARRKKIEQQQPRLIHNTQRVYTQKSS